MKKRFLSMLLALAMVLALFPAALAADVTEEQTAGETAYESEAYDAPYSGTCGDSVSWSIENGKLTISGTGRMDDYSGGTVPWNSYKDLIIDAEIKEGVTNIGKCAFHTCYGLMSVSIASSVTSIGEMAFLACWDLREIVLPESVTGIGANAFNGCTALETITLPISLTSIGASAFSGCSALAAAKYKGTEAQWNAVQVGYGNGSLTAVLRYGQPVVVASGTSGEVTWTLTEEGLLIISGNGAMKNYYYPGNSQIPAWDPYKEQIKSVEVGPGVTSLGDYAFYCYYPNLESVSFGPDLKRIGKSAFAFSNALTEVTIPASVTEIGEEAFTSGYVLKAIHVEAGNSMFSSEGGILYNKNKTKLIQCPAAISGKLTIPAGVKSIGANAFKSSNLTDVYLPEGVTDIGESAFETSRLQSINLPSSLTYIPVFCFEGCGLLKVTLPEGISKINNYAFMCCSCLTEITIPVSMTEIGEGAFYMCSSLKNVCYNGTSYEWAQITVDANHNSPLKNAALHCIEPERPAAPANLTASNKSTGVSLTWDAVSGADSYIVCRNGVQLGTCTAASYTDKTAKSGSEYAYTVQAAAGDAHSADSDAAKIMYLSVPANVKCTNGSEGITVTWDKVEGATGYTLYRRLSTTTAWTAVFTSTKATTLSKLDTGVKDGKTYYYTVRANYKSTDGNTKYYSSKATTGTKIVCSIVSTLAAPTVKSIVNGFSSILVKWSKVTGADGYYVYRKAENGSTWTKLKTVAQPTTGSTVSFGNTTPKNGETYTYKVVAYKGTTLSTDSNEKTYMRLTYPTLTAKSTNAGKISFSWTDNEYATSFQIEYTTADTFTGATRKTLTEYKTSTSYSGFESGKTYHVRVRAFKKYWNNAEGKYMYYYGTWSSADETGASTQTVKVK